MLLIDQNVRKNLEITDRGYVLENGRVVPTAITPADTSNAPLEVTTPLMP